MDRREALKKLAVGGATAAGLTAVMTSTAFANPGTANCAASGTPTVTGSRNGSAGNITLTLGVAGVTCPCPGGGTASLVSAPTWQLNGNGPTSQTASAPYSAFWNAQGTFINWNYTVNFRVRCLDRNGQPVCALFSGSGTASHTHPNLVVSPVSGSLVYDSAVCPAP